MRAAHARVRLTGLAIALAIVTAGCVNLHTVEDGKVYRAAQPDAEQLTRWIWRYDIETVVRLRGGDPSRESWRASHDPTVAAGIDFVQRPMSANRFPERHELADLCEIFETARYPILLHCKAGADRTGLASAVYVLHSTGDLDRARGELSLAYLHTGWPSTHCLDETLDLYEPYQDQISFCTWAREVYERPEDDEVTDAYLEAMRQRALRLSQQ